MANLTAVFFSNDDLNLARLVATIRDTEQIFGPLMAISRCEDFPQRLTCFTHEDATPPSSPIDLHLCPNDQIPTVPGKILVCIGNCFISGQKSMVAAFR
jgi:hypothetical protein